MLQLEARAKINWTLDILGRREDGYHLMDMLMQSVCLADEVTLTEADTLSLTVRQGSYTTQTSETESSSAPVPTDERNIAYKAALALQHRTGCQKGAAITLTKNIPSGAGMGGGSADAAAVLYGLNKLWGLGLTHEKLLEIGLTLGADMPFMLTGGLARVGGIGECIAPLCPAPQVWLLLIQPCDGLSTGEIFTAYDSPAPDLFIRHPRTDAAQQALITGDLVSLAAAMDNVLEGISIAKRPAIEAAGRQLEAAGALRGMMTGSGSVVYGVFADRAAAEGAKAYFDELDVRCLLTCTAADGIVCKG